MKGILSFLLILGLVKISQAQTPPFTVGHPLMSGNGCPLGTADAVVLDDGSTVSILFDRFIIQGRKGINSWDNMRRFCNFKIPVSIPAGYILKATSINYRGFANLPKAARAIIMTSGPVADPMGSSVGDYNVKSEIRNMVQNFDLIQPLPQNFRNQCQPQTQIEFNTILQLFGPAPKVLFALMEDASVTIDSADIGGATEPIRIKFRVRPCGKN